MTSVREPAVAGLFYPGDPRELEQVVRRLLAAAGWRVTRIIHHRSLSSLIGSMGFVLQDELGVEDRVTRYVVNFPRSGSKLEHLLAPISRILAWSRQTGRMTLWAEPCRHSPGSAP